MTTLLLAECWRRKGSADGERWVLSEAPALLSSRARITQAREGTPQGPGKAPLEELEGTILKVKIGCR